MGCLPHPRQVMDLYSSQKKRRSKVKSAKSPNCFKESADLQMLQLWDILTDVVWHRLNKRWRLMRLLGHKLLLTLLTGKVDWNKQCRLVQSNAWLTSKHSHGKLGKHTNYIHQFSQNAPGKQWFLYTSQQTSGRRESRRFASPTEGHFWEIRRKVSTAICWTPGKVSCMNSKSLKITVFKNFQCAPGSKKIQLKKRRST